MRSEQILTQYHLIEQRMQPLLLVDLRHRCHLLIVLLEAELLGHGLLLNTLVHFNCVVGERSLSRHVLFLNLRTELLRVTHVLFDLALFVLYVLVVRHANGLIVHCVHVLSDARAVSTAVGCLEGRELRTNDLHRCRLLHLHLRCAVVLAERVYQRWIVHVRVRFLERWLCVCDVSHIWVATILLFIKRHRTLYQVDPLQILLLKSLIQHLEFDFLALTTVELLVIVTIRLTVGLLLIQNLEVIELANHLVPQRMRLVHLVATIFLCLINSWFLLVDLHVKICLSLSLEL